MPISEMHTEFKHLYDKESNFSAPEITPEAIDIYLNSAQSDLINTLVKEGIEKNQDWADMLKNITLTHTTVPYTNINNKPNGVFVDLPVNYRLALLERVTVTYTGCNNQQTTAYASVKPITRDTYNKIISDPFGKPWKEEVLRLVDSGDKFELIGDSSLTVTIYYLDYIKEPVQMQYGTQYATPVSDVDCELDLKAAEVILDIAVKKALQTIGDPRLVTIQYDSLIKKI
jgi:hypothetical protein